MSGFGNGFPTAPRKGPAGATGATGPTGPTGPPATEQTATSDTAGTKGYAWRRKSNGHVEQATGVAPGDGAGVGGVYKADVAMGATATLVMSGGRLAVTGLTPGPVWRSSTGAPVPVGSLTPGDATNFLGNADSTGLDVLAGREETA